jgi:hypothetical protein
MSIKKPTIITFVFLKKMKKKNIVLNTFYTRKNLYFNTSHFSSNFNKEQQLLK